MYAIRKEERQRFREFARELVRCEPPSMNCSQCGGAGEIPEEMVGWIETGKKLRKMRMDSASLRATQVMAQQPEMLRFEVGVKMGRGWRYLGIFTAKTSVSAATQAKRLHPNRHIFRVRPEDSRDKWLVYRRNMPPKVEA